MGTPWDSFGLRLWEGAPPPMREAHQHGEIELNAVRDGEVTYVLGGELVRVRAGELLLFWGARPHRLIARAPTTRFFVLTLPLVTFLRFGLPDVLTERVLQGEPVLSAASTDDAARLDHWLTDGNSPEERHILELELEARLRRLALALRASSAREAPHREAPGARNLDRATRLAQLIARQYTNPDLELSALAREAGLHPNTAATLFRETFGTTMGRTLTQYRVAHAQRLLLTTDAAILDVAAEAGFGSPSRFYAAFRAACRQTPLDYRRSLRAPHVV